MLTPQMGPPSDSVDYELRITARCLREDLGIEDDDGADAFSIIANNEVAKAFVEKRSQRATGQETIQGLVSKAVTYSLHAGAHRGITWHDEKNGVVWLMAARFHRSGKPDDAYPYFVELDAKAKLFPDRDDFAALLRARTASFADVLKSEAEVLTNRAVDEPGEIIPGTIGGRVEVRLAFEEGDPPLVTVAISQRLRPGTLTLPPHWNIVVAAAFLPNTPPDQLCGAFEIAGADLREDEWGFCDFVEDEADSGD